MASSWRLCRLGRSAIGQPRGPVISPGIRCRRSSTFYRGLFDAALDMRIAVLASSFYPHVGGVEELVLQLSKAYGAKGHDSVILTNRWPPSLPKTEEYEGLAVSRVPMRIPEGPFRARVRYHLSHRSALARALATLRRHGTDVVHVQCVGPNGYFALLAARALKVPLVVTVQGELTMDSGRLYQRSAFANSVLRQLAVEADFVTGCSQKTLSDLESHVGVSLAGKSLRIFNGVDVAAFRRAAPHRRPHPYVLGLGRLVPQKGFDLLIRAFSQARARSHDLIIVGDGPERQALETLARRPDLDGRVFFTGNVGRDDVKALFRGCSFFVLPSRADEGLPLVTAEAMAAGKAIVASTVGGVPESVVDMRTGLLVPGDDVPALAAAISRLAEDDELRGRLGAGGSRRADQFDWPGLADQYLGVFMEVVRRRG